MTLMKRNRRILTASVSGLLFAVLIILVRFVDVQAIGPEGTRIGLSHLNRLVFESLGVRMLWYEITDWLGIAAIGTALLFAVVGLAQWVKRKSIWKVDREILALGALYLRGDFGQISNLERSAVLLDDLHQRDVVEVEFAIFCAELILREIEGLVDQIVVFVFHPSEFVLLL